MVMNMKPLPPLIKYSDILINIPAHMYGGADFNRSPEEMVSESEGRYMAITTHAPQTRTTCSVGGLIDYFVTHENERTIKSDVRVISDTVVTPHSPVAATIN